MSAWTKFRDALVDGFKSITGLSGEHVLVVSHAIKPTTELGEERLSIANPIPLFSVIKNYQTDKSITSQVADDILNGHNGSLRKLFKASKKEQFHNRIYPTMQYDEYFVYAVDSPLWTYLYTIDYTSNNNLDKRDLIYVSFEDPSPDDANKFRVIFTHEGIGLTAIDKDFNYDNGEQPNALTDWYIDGHDEELLDHNISNIVEKELVEMALDDVDDLNSEPTYPIKVFKANGRFVINAPNGSIEKDLYRKSAVLETSNSSKYRTMIRQLSATEYSEQEPVRNDYLDLTDDEFNDLYDEWESNKSNFEDSLGQTYHSFIGMMISVERDTDTAKKTLFTTMKHLHVNYTNIDIKNITYNEDGTINYEETIHFSGEATIDDNYGFQPYYETLTYDGDPLEKEADLNPLIVAKVSTLQRVTVTKDGEPYATIDSGGGYSGEFEVIEYLAQYGIGFTHYTYDTPLVYEVHKPIADDLDRMVDVTLEKGEYALYWSWFSRIENVEKFIRADKAINIRTIEVQDGEENQNFHAAYDKTDTPIRLNIAYGTDDGGYEVYRIHLLTNSFGVSYEDKYKVSTNKFYDRVKYGGDGFLKPKGELVLPLLKTVVDELHFSDKYRLYKEAEVIVFLYAEDIYIPWYKSEVFLRIVQVALIVASLVSLLIDWSGSTAQLLVAVASTIVISVAVEWAVKIALEELKGKNSFLQALVIAVIVVMSMYLGGDIGGEVASLSTSEILLEAIQIVNKITDLYSRLSEAELLEHAKEMREEFAEYISDINELQEAYLDEEDDGMSLLVNTLVNEQHAETPEEMQYRSLEFNVLDNNYDIILPTIDVTNLLKL